MNFNFCNYFNNLNSRKKDKSTILDNNLNNSQNFINRSNNNIFIKSDNNSNIKSIKKTYF